MRLSEVQWERADAPDEFYYAYVTDGTDAFKLFKWWDATYSADVREGPGSGRYVFNLEADLFWMTCWLQDKKQITVEEYFE